MYIFLLTLITIIIILLCIKTSKKIEKKHKKTFAIHSVFILKENILFLEEWISYHILLGFDKFYLYDNSKVTKSGGCHPKHKCFKAGKVNKYNVNYDTLVNMSDKEMNNYVKKLCDKYKCIEFIDWSPTDNNGQVLHNQEQAHNNCLQKLKKDNIDWCATIDIDEYIVIKNFDNIGKYISQLPKNIKNIQLSQIIFDSRFNNLDKLVTDITDSELTDLDTNHSNKNIYNVDNTLRVQVHSVSIKEQFRQYKPHVKEICFNHYKLTSDKYKYVNNINHNIKSKLKKDSFIPMK